MPHNVNSDGPVTIISTDHTVVVTESVSEVSIQSQAGLTITAPSQEITIYEQRPLLVIDPGKEGSNPYFDKSPSLMVISGIAAIRGLVKVDLSWVEQDNSDYHSHTEVWRGTVDNINGAICVGDSRTQSFTDTIEPELNYYYWLRAVTFVGNKSEFFGSHSVSSSLDSETLKNFLNIDDLYNQLAQLEIDLRAELALLASNVDTNSANDYTALTNIINTNFALITDNIISTSNTLGLQNSKSYAGIQDQLTLLINENIAFVNTVSTLTASLTSEGATRAAEIETINTAYASLNSALASTTTSLQASIANEKAILEALITAENVARVNENLVLASTVTSLSSQIDDEVANRTAAIDAERTTRVTNESATATLVNTLSSGFVTAESTLNARITNTDNTRASEDSTLATSIADLNTTFNGLFGTTSADVAALTSALSDEAGSRGLYELDATARFEGIEGVVTAQGGLIIDVATKADGTATALAELTASIASDGDAAAAIVRLDALDDVVDGLSARAVFGTDINGNFTGITVEGSTDRSSVSFDATEFSLRDGATQALYYSGGVWNFKGILRLSDGTSLDTAADIVGAPGPTPSVIKVDDTVTIDNGVDAPVTIVDGASVLVTLTSDQGQAFKNNVGDVKTITANVFIGGAESEDYANYIYNWTANNQPVYASNSGIYAGHEPGFQTYLADGADPSGINLRSIQITPSDVESGINLFLNCVISNI